MSSSLSFGGKNSLTGKVIGVTGLSSTLEGSGPFADDDRQQDHSAVSTSFRSGSLPEFESDLQSVSTGSHTGGSGTHRTSSLASLPPQKRMVNDLSDLKIDKLRMDSLGFHGRDQEVEFLKNQFQALVEADAERRLLMVSGTSGCGKSKLVDSLERVALRRKNLYIKGKFDLNMRDQPYSAIASACAEVCGLIVRLQQSSTEAAKANQTCAEIQEGLGSEGLDLLIRVIPALKEIVDVSSSQQQGNLVKEFSNNKLFAGASPSLSGEEAKNQIKFVFLRFLRIICENFTPLVMVLDDLQWADASSLELLDVILSDQLNRKLMVIGIYRSNEVDEKHTFSHYLQEIQAKSQSGDFQLAQLEVKNLDMQSVNRVIQDVLDCQDDTRTLALAQICHEKTMGNPFFLIHYLELLCSKKLLSYNLGTFSWTWSADEIKSNTDASDNVVDILKTKMKGFTPELLKMLKLASFLGSSFEVDFLRRLWCKWSDDSPLESAKDDSKFDYSLVQLEAEGLIIKVSETPPRERWVHNKIHEAAIDLIADVDRAAWSRKVGEMLLADLDDEQLDSALFVVVKLLNATDSEKLDIETRVKWAELNCQACLKAVEVSAFDNAAMYAGKGIELLPKDCWEKHRYLCLNLYSVGARAEGSMGNIMIMDRYCKVVLEQQNIPFEEKFDIYHTLTDVMFNATNAQEASDLLYEILGRFKCRLPNNTLSIGLGVVANVIRVKATMKSRDPSKLSTMTDATRMQLMRFLDKLASCCYTLKDDRLALVIFRTLNWTIKYGICDQSPAAFATTGIILNGILGDSKGGAIYGQHALDLLKHAPSRSTVSRTMMCVYGFIFSWTKPSRSLIKPLLEAYEIGLQTGDTESATGAILNYMLLQFISGISLKTLEADLSLYSKQMKDLKRGPNLKSAKGMHQTVLNLMGRNNHDDPTNFVGDAMSQEDYDQSRIDSFWNSGVYFFQGILFTYFGEHASHADTMVRNGHDYLAKGHVAAAAIMPDYCLKGVSCFAMARKTGKKKYAKLGKLCRTKIKRWLDVGNPNVSHYDSLLEAEYAAYMGQNFSAIKLYEVAILLAGRGGYQQDAALASERLGEFQIEVMKDVDEGRYRIGEAIRYWGGYGAMAKVEHLEQKYL